MSTKNPGSIHANWTWATRSKLALEKENSPQRKKFKFAPISNSRDGTEGSPIDLTESPEAPKKKMEKRKGFVAPRKNAVFYGDSDSDDDFK